MIYTISLGSADFNCTIRENCPAYRPSRSGCFKGHCNIVLEGPLQCCPDLEICRKHFTKNNFLNVNYSFLMYTSRASDVKRKLMLSWYSNYAFSTFMKYNIIRFINLYIEIAYCVFAIFMEYFDEIDLWFFIKELKRSEGCYINEKRYLPGDFFEYTKYINYICKCVENSEGKNNFNCFMLNGIFQ